MTNVFPSVAIVDYGLGNLMSVRNALALLGVQAKMTSDPVDISSSTHLILPGVGSFVEGMRGLREKGLIELLHQEVLEKKKRILGICLGMQLFATEGYEHEHCQGLNFIQGKVLKIDTAASGLRLPHIGWNDVRVAGDHVITRGFDHVPVFYFVHSYHLFPQDGAVIAGVCDYGQEFAALIEKGNIFGAQFHPEKSHEDGMVIFRNFLGL
jgi:glutamine amidotransferase